MQFDCEILPAFMGSQPSESVDECSKNEVPQRDCDQKDDYTGCRNMSLPLNANAQYVAMGSRPYMQNMLVPFILNPTAYRSTIPLGNDLRMMHPNYVSPSITDSSPCYFKPYTFAPPRYPQANKGTIAQQDTTNHQLSTKYIPQAHSNSLQISTPYHGLNFSSQIMNEQRPLLLHRSEYVAHPDYPFQQQSPTNRSETKSLKKKNSPVCNLNSSTDYQDDVRSGQISEPSQSNMPELYSFLQQNSGVVSAQAHNTLFQTAPNRYCIPSSTTSKTAIRPQQSAAHKHQHLVEEKHEIDIGKPLSEGVKSPLPYCINSELPHSRILPYGRVIPIQSQYPPCNFPCRNYPFATQLSSQSVNEATLPLIPHSLDLPTSLNNERLFPEEFMKSLSVTKITPSLEESAQSLSCISNASHSTTSTSQFQSLFPNTICMPGHVKTQKRKRTNRVRHARAETTTSIARPKQSPLSRNSDVKMRGQEISNYLTMPCANYVTSLPAAEISKSVASNDCDTTRHIHSKDPKTHIASANGAHPQSPSLSFPYITTQQHHSHLDYMKSCVPISQQNQEMSSKQSIVSSSVLQTSTPDLSVMSSKEHNYEDVSDDEQLNVQNRTLESKRELEKKLAKDLELFEKQLQETEESSEYVDVESIIEELTLTQIVLENSNQTYDLLLSKDYLERLKEKYASLHMLKKRHLHNLLGCIDSSNEFNVVDNLEVDIAQHKWLYEEWQKIYKTKCLNYLTIARILHSCNNENKENEIPSAERKGTK